MKKDKKDSIEFQTRNIQMKCMLKTYDQDLIPNSLFNSIDVMFWNEPFEDIVFGFVNTIESNISESYFEKLKGLK